MSAHPSGLRPTGLARPGTLLIVLLSVWALSGLLFVFGWLDVWLWHAIGAGLLLAAHPQLARRLVLVGAPAMGVVPGRQFELKAWRHLKTPQEQADIHREQKALKAQPDVELEELIAIYESRGLAPDTARLVAVELTEHDALGAHIRDELGLVEEHAANPMQAALASAVTFSLSGAIPLLAALLSPADQTVRWVLAVTLAALAVLGIAGARAGGAPVLPALARVLVWGSFAMAVTAGIGHVFGIAA